MFNKIKAKWNVMLTHSVVFVAFAMFESIVNNNLDKSLTFFGIGMVFMGLADLYNQNIKTQAMLKTLLIKSREGEIYERLLEYEEKGDKILMSKEEVIKALSKDDIK